MTLMRREMLLLYSPQKSCRGHSGRRSQPSQAVTPFWGLDYLTATAFNWFVICPTATQSFQCSKRCAGKAVVPTCDNSPQTTAAKPGTINLRPRRPHLYMIPPQFPMEHSVLKPLKFQENSANHEPLGHVLVP